MTHLSWIATVYLPTPGYPLIRITVDTDDISALGNLGSAGSNLGVEYRITEIRRMTIKRVMEVKRQVCDVSQRDLRRLKYQRKKKSLGGERAMIPLGARILSKLKGSSKHKGTFDEYTNQTFHIFEIGYSDDRRRCKGLSCS